MKNLAIRLQIVLILLIFISPLIYLGLKQFQPEITLMRYDKLRAQRDLTYPQVSWLSTQDKSIVDANGKPIILRGVNIASTTWGPDYETWNPQAVETAIKTWHANVIRTRVHQYEFEDNPSTFFYKLESQILEPARRNGAYVILHPWFGENESLPNNRGTEMWLALAKRYRDDPHILFDLFAEPRDITQADLKSAYSSIIPKVRSVHPRSLIFVTGLDWGRAINAWLDDPLPYTNLVYRTNPYNRTGEFESYFGRIAQTKPVFIGEFGTETKLSMTEKDVESLLGYADTLGIGWTAWHFSSTGCPCLLSDNNSFAASAYGNLVKNSLLGQKYSYKDPIFDTDSHKFYLYSDFMENGYSDYSWLSKTTLQDPDKVAGGASAFHAAMGNSGGVYLHSSRVIAKDGYTSFSMQLVSPLADRLSLRFRGPKDEFSSPIMIKDVSVKNGEWLSVTIPVTQISIPMVTGFTLESTEPVASAVDIYLDQIYFSK